VKNIIKGYFSTSLGVVLIGLSIYSLLWHTKKEIDNINLLIMFGLGCLFVYTPATFIEKTIEKIVNKYFGNGKDN
jgi:hypothetical protein